MYPLTVQRRTALAVGGTAACLGALAAASGSIAAPAATGGVSYEVAVPWEAAFRGADSALARGAGSPSETPLGLGSNAVSTHLGNVVVLGGWLLVALRKMDAVAGALTAVSTVLLAVVLSTLSLGGGDAVVMSDVPPSVRLYLVAAVVVVAATVVAFSVPDRLRRPDGDEAELPSLARFRGAPGSETTTDVAPDPSPSDPIERAWLDVTREVGGDSWTTRTPGEIECEAAASGRPEEAVRDLRRLFERVRYGGESATDEHRERARALRDRIGGAAGDHPAAGHNPDDREGSP